MRVVATLFLSPQIQEEIINNSIKKEKAIKQVQARDNKGRSEALQLDFPLIAFSLHHFFVFYTTTIAFRAFFLLLSVFLKGTVMQSIFKK